MENQDQTQTLRGIPTGKDEMNLAEFPFAVLSDRSRTTKLAFSDTIKGKCGQIIPRSWIIVGTDEFGLPTPDDEKIYIALLQLSKEQGFESEEVSFTRYQLLKLIGWPTRDGRYYRRLRLGLYRLKTITIIVNNAWYNPKTQEYETHRGFSIISDFSMWGKDPYSPGDRGSFRRGSITWGKTVWKSIQNGNIKNLDVNFWLTLRSAIARRLYRYLDKKFYQNHIFRIELNKLAFEKLGMSRSYKKPTKIKSLLNPACEELIDKGYLKAYTYRKKENGDHIITFLRSEKGRQVEMNLPKNQLGLLNQLTDRGITRTTASNLLKQYPTDRIIQKIELHDYLISTRSHLLGKNPAGYLRKAIEEDYTPPDGFTTRAEREQHKSEQEEAKQLERDRKEKEFQQWLNSPDDEKISGKLSFWKQTFRMRHGTEPTSQEIDSKKRELISTLPTPEEKRRQMFGDT